MSDRGAFEKWCETQESTYHKSGMWKAWQAAQAQAVNQQLLEAIKVCASFLSDFGLENSDAYQQALFAIAAAQEQGK